MENMTVGQRIASRRKLANLSQESISEQLGVSRQSVSKWESDAGMPDVDNLIALSKIFGVSVGWLLGIERDPSFDPSTGLSEAQLHMVKKVVEGRRPKRWYRYAAAGLAACILVPSVVFVCSFARLKGENADVQKQITALKEQVGSIDETLLQQRTEKNLLLNVYTKPYLNDDGESVTVDFYFWPKLFQENAQAYLMIRGEVGRIDMEWQQLECSVVGNWYHCRTEIPLNNGYHYSFILANDSGFQEQQLDGEDYIYPLLNLSDGVCFHLDESAETRTEWNLKNTVYRFDQPIATPYISRRTAYVGYEEVEVVLYHNNTPIHTESLRQDFLDLGGAYMLSEVPLIPDIQAELPSLAEGDRLRLEITTKDYDGNMITGVLEDLMVTAAVDKTK